MLDRTVLNRSNKVLVACHTNIACDNAIEHLLRYEHEYTVKNLLDNGEIVRIGTPVLQNDRLKELTIDAIYKRLSATLVENKECLVKQIVQLTKISKEYYEYKQSYTECQTIITKIEQCKKSISEYGEIILHHTEEEKKFNALIGEKSAILSIAENRSSITNFFKGTRPKRLRFLIDKLNQGKLSLIKTRAEKEKFIKMLSEELAKLHTYHSQKSASLPSGITIEHVEKMLQTTQKELEYARAEMKVIEEKLSKLNEGILNNAKIVVSTLAKTFIEPNIMNTLFDIVVVDEASSAPLPMLFYVCSLAKKKVIIIGDPKQLSPIKLANTIAAERWLKKDIFQEANALKAKPEDGRIRRLNNQYRMNENIFTIVNDKFYGSELNNRRKEDNSYNNLPPKPDYRVILIDTSKANACVSSERMGAKSFSRYNLYNIQVIEKLVHDLFANDQITERDIAIITPYRSQASFIRQILLDLKLKDIDVGTVHSFQGIEKKYVIYDLVEAPGGKRISGLLNDKHEVYRGKREDENEALRLNTVAFSRPQEKLVIISHNEHMLKELPRDSIFREIIEGLVRDRATVDATGLVPFYVPAEELPEAALFEAEDLIKKEAVFNQKSFYPHFIKDIREATQEVIFISGYMSTQRIEKLMPFLKELLSKGINIKIFTKPPREQMTRQKELEELHHKLKNIGIEIYQHYGTHEKVVAIDKHILYAGSLNVLSFNHGSKEMMIRSDSNAKLQKVFSVLAKNYPRLNEYLVKGGYIVHDLPVDLMPGKFTNIIDSVRPKNRALPKGKNEARSYYDTMLTKLRWVIADDKRIPVFAVLFRKTLESMLSNPPRTLEELISLPEFRRNRSNIGGYENIVLEILKEYAAIAAK